MLNTINKNRVFIFLAFAFGIAWVVGLIVYFTGGILNSPEVIPGSNISLALILFSMGYMWAPALANIFTRLVTRQGWGELLLSPSLKKNWKYWAAAWLMPAVLTIFGSALYFLVFPAQFDTGLTTVRQLLEDSSLPTDINPWILLSGNIIQAILIAPVINSFFTFGEEFGWRGYLLPNLLPLGKKKAYLYSGVIWGIWHAPAIAMGHNFGLDYPGFPWLGILGMTWFCVMAGTFLGYLSTRAGSIWPAVIGHAAINGIAGLPLLFLIGKPNLILGPTPVGLIGSVGFLLFFLWVYFLRK